MNKLTLLFIFLLVVCPVSIYSQQAAITGKIVTSNGQPVEYANVQLLNADSIFITGSASDRNGRFTLEATPYKDYLLIISALGYEPLQIVLMEIREKSILGDLALNEASVALDEVTVKANYIIHHIDRQAVFPSILQQKSANNAFELLNNMSLPKVITNLQDKKISLLGNDQLSIKINGVNANEYEISSIPSEDIIRIDYYDNPGVRFNGNTVLDFIVKKRNAGGSFNTNLTNSPHLGFGNDLVSTKVNYKNSEWAASYFLSYRDYKKCETDETTLFYFPDKTIERNMQGIPSPFNYQTHNIQLNYNYTLPDKRVFNISLTEYVRNNNNHLKSNNYYSDIPDRAFLSQTDTKNKKQNPIIDLYYKENLSATQSIMANLVGGFIKTDYTRNYREKNTSNESTSDFYSQIAGKKYSVIGEIIHQKEWSKLALYTGINYKIGYTANNYNGSVSENTSLINNDLYFYTQLQGKINKLSYGIGLGASYSHFDDRKTSYRFMTFRPFLTLNYNLLNNLNLQYSFNIKPQIPALSQLSDVEQIEDQFQIYQGNSTLKPYRIYTNKININYVKNRFMYSVELAHKYYNRIIMPDILFDSNRNFFVKTNNNQRYYQTTTLLAGFRWKIINEILDLYLNGQINWIDSKGNTYHQKYTSYYGMAALYFNYKKWTVQTGVNSRNNDLFGETITYGEWSSYLNLGYKFKNLYLGLSAYNFLTDRYSTGYKNKSQIMPSTSWYYTYDSAPIICFNLSWNFSWGKQSKAEQKKLQNKDADSGIMTVK